MCFVLLYGESRLETVDLGRGQVVLYSADFHLGLVCGRVECLAKEGDWRHLVGADGALHEY